MLIFNDFCVILTPMLEKSHAIVLHTLKYGDQKVVVEMFTRTWGRLSFIVTLPKSAKSPFRKQYFQPMTVLEVECDVRPRVALQKLHDVRLLVPYTTIPLSPAKLSITLFIAEFLYYALRSEQRNEQLFDYIMDSMQWLDAAPSHYANFHLTFLMRLSRFLGFYPNMETPPDLPSLGEGPYTPPQQGELERVFFDLREGLFTSTVPTHQDYLAPAEARMIHLLMRMDYPTMHLFQLSQQDRGRILDVLMRYYKLHLPDFPDLRSLAVLHQLWI